MIQSFRRHQEMHRDLFIKRHASSISKMDLVKPEETTIIEPAMSQ